MVKPGRKQKIGVLGGTFDPVHQGHLVLAETACSRLGLDKLLFIPTYQPPHKRHPGMATAEMRCAMLRLAAAGNRKFYVSPVEIERQGISYSVETLRGLRRRYPQAELYFIAGSDAGRELKTWKCIDEIFSLCTFVIATRPGFRLRCRPKQIKVLAGGFLDISSSAVRAAVRRGDSIRYLVPEKVWRFIRNHRLYQ